jgi:site-specific recombinase XerD
VKSSIDTRTITRRFKRLCETAGLDSRLYSSHSARHTVITKMFLDGLPSVVVKNFARHQSLVTTQKYFSKLEQSVDAAKSLNFFDIKEG